MRVLVVSDTHRRNDNYFKVLEKEKNLDLIIHCGDSEGSEYALSESADCPVQLVTGNNDFFSSLPRELEIEIEGYKVWVTHGHNYYVNMSDEFIKEEARARGVDIVMYGHTHRPVINESKGVIAINPGSLTYPRQEGRKPTYIIMEVEKKEVGKKPKFSVCHV
ncbi:MAG: metallophosphoesterase [Lachnospiraceae bacterium]|nr:metallophosphoesterase [Lachnospiraceae bacterium]